MSLQSTWVSCLLSSFVVVSAGCGGADRSLESHQVSQGTTLSESDKGVLTQLETLSKSANETALTSYAAENFGTLDKIGNMPKGTPERERLVAVANAYPKAIDKAHEHWLDKQASENGELSLNNRRNQPQTTSASRSLGIMNYRQRSW